MPPATREEWHANLPVDNKPLWPTLRMPDGYDYPQWARTNARPLLQLTRVAFADKEIVDKKGRRIMLSSLPHLSYPAAHALDLSPSPARATMPRDLILSDSESGHLYKVHCQLYQRPAHCCHNCNANKLQRPCLVVSWSPPDPITGAYPKKGIDGRPQEIAMDTCYDCLIDGRKCDKVGMIMDGPRALRFVPGDQRQIRTINEMLGIPTRYSLFTTAMQKAARDTPNSNSKKRKSEVTLETPEVKRKIVLKFGGNQNSSPLASSSSSPIKSTTRPAPESQPNSPLNRFFSAGTAAQTNRHQNAEAGPSSSPHSSAASTPPDLGNPLHDDMMQMQAEMREKEALHAAIAAMEADAASYTEAPMASFEAPTAIAEPEIVVKSEVVHEAHDEPADEPMSPPTLSSTNIAAEAQSERSTPPPASALAISLPVTEPVPAPVPDRPPAEATTELIDKQSGVAASLSTDLSAASARAPATMLASTSVTAPVTISAMTAAPAAVTAPIRAPVTAPATESPTAPSTALAKAPVTTLPTVHPAPAIVPATAPEVSAAQTSAAMSAPTVIATLNTTGQASSLPAAAAASASDSTLILSAEPATEPAKEPVQLPIVDSALRPLAEVNAITVTTAPSASNPSTLVTTPAIAGPSTCPTPFCTNHPASDYDLTTDPIQKYATLQTRGVIVRGYSAEHQPACDVPAFKYPHNAINLGLERWVPTPQTPMEPYKAALVRLRGARGGIFPMWLAFMYTVRDVQCTNCKSAGHTCVITNWITPSPALGESSSQNHPYLDACLCCQALMPKVTDRLLKCSIAGRMMSGPKAGSKFVFDRIALRHAERFCNDLLEAGIYTTSMAKQHNKNKKSGTARASSASDQIKTPKVEPARSTTPQTLANTQTLSSLIAARAVQVDHHAAGPSTPTPFPPPTSTPHSVARSFPTREEYARLSSPSASQPLLPARGPHGTMASTEQPPKSGLIGAGQSPDTAFAGDTASVVKGSLLAPFPAETPDEFKGPPIADEKEETPSKDASGYAKVLPSGEGEVKGGATDDMGSSDTSIGDTRIDKAEVTNMIGIIGSSEPSQQEVQPTPLSNGEPPHVEKVSDAPLTSSQQIADLLNELTRVKSEHEVTRAALEKSKERIIMYERLTDPHVQTLQKLIKGRNDALAEKDALARQLRAAEDLAASRLVEIEKAKNEAVTQVVLKEEAEAREKATHARMVQFRLDALRK